MNYLVSFINTISVDAPEGTSEEEIINAAQQWVREAYKDNPMQMLGDCLDITTEWKDVPCANLSQGFYKARVLQEILPDDDFWYCEEEPTVTIESIK